MLAADSSSAGQGGRVAAEVGVQAQAQAEVVVVVVVVRAAGCMRLASSERL